MYFNSVLILDYFLSFIVAFIYSEILPERGPKMAEEKDGEIMFSPTKSTKEHLTAEHTPQNHF